MKKLIKNIKKAYKHELEFAKRVGFSGVLVCGEQNGAMIYLETSYDNATLCEFATQNGWEKRCILFDFERKEERILQLETEIA